jgi:hypothetical protein
MKAEARQHLLSEEVQEEEEDEEYDATSNPTKQGWVDKLFVEFGPCDESSLVSELTQMTYRAEFKKQVSSEIILIMYVYALICGTQPLTSSPFHHR